MNGAPADVAQREGEDWWRCGMTTMLGRVEIRIWED